MSCCAKKDFKMSEISFSNLSKFSLGQSFDERGAGSKKKFETKQTMPPFFREEPALAIFKFVQFSRLALFKFGNFQVWRFSIFAIFKLGNF